MTQAPVAGPRVGLRLLADRRRLSCSPPAAAAHRAPRRRRARPARRRRSWAARSQAIGPPPITDPDPVTIYDQGGIVLVQPVPRVPHRPQQRQLAASRSSPRAGRPTTTLDVWTFKLRQGVTFNDGSPFEAEDVVTSIERVLDPNERLGRRLVAARAACSRRGGTKAVDATTVEFNLDKPFADFPYTGVAGQLQHAPSCRAPTTGDILKNPVGTGPFMLDQYTTKQKATFKKNPTYWGKDASGHQLPYLDGLEYVMVEDDSAAEPAAAVRRRRLPAADGVPGRAGAVRRPQPPRGHLPGHRHPRGRVQPSTRSRGRAAAPSSSARPSPTASTAPPSTRPCTTAAATSATTPSGSRRCSRAARTPPAARPGLRQGQAAALRRRLTPAGSTSS